MPVHDWTRVEAGMFHDFHNAWITHLRDALNGGLLPPDYYALGEQHAGHLVTDVLTLHASRPNGQPPVPPAAASLWPRRRPKCGGSSPGLKRIASYGVRSRSAM